jgi:hypothetical protein
MSNLEIAVGLVFHLTGGHVALVLEEVRNVRDALKNKVSDLKAKYVT